MKLRSWPGHILGVLEKPYGMVSSFVVTQLLATQQQLAIKPLDNSTSQCSNILLLLSEKELVSEFIKGDMIKYAEFQCEMLCILSFE
jgi:hypothetical protein